MKAVEIRNLFGTDGIRGSVGRFPLDEESILQIGRAIALSFPGQEVLIGRDTRASGPWIQTILATALHRFGKEVSGCGIIPTPGLSYLVARGSWDLGLMITASHNPFEDNGIKIFNGNGEKISPQEERVIEHYFFSPEALPAGNKSFFELEEHIRPDDYVDFLLSLAGDLDLCKKKIVLDCANGATSPIVDSALMATKAAVILLNNRPDGKNINQRCGSTYPDHLARSVIRTRADLGFAFDGDGDRVIVADCDGRILSGDHLLLLFTRYYLAMGEACFNRCVVGTDMTNMALEKELAVMNVRLERAPVGDRNVFARMETEQSILGGEPSGHIIFKALQYTGDGMVSALMVLKALQKLGSTVDDLYRNTTMYPQITWSIPVSQRRDLSSWNELQEKISRFESEYGHNSRVLIRYSGTEAKIRIMIESEDPAIIEPSLETFKHIVRLNTGG